MDVLATWCAPLRCTSSRSWCIGADCGCAFASQHTSEVFQGYLYHAWYRNLPKLKGGYSYPTISARGRKTHEAMSTPTRGGAPPSRPQSASSARRPSSGKGFTDAARAAAAAARKEPAADRQTGRGSSEAVLRAGEPECRRSKLIGRRCAAGGGGVGY